MHQETPGLGTSHDDGNSPSGGPSSGEFFRLAALMARKGRYDEALRTLGQAVIVGECSDAEALDLQARIYVQQGMLLRAESCWTEALQKDPGNADFVAALARLRRVHTRWPLNGVGLFFLGAIVVLVVVLGFILNGYYQVRAQQSQLSSKLTLIESALHGTLIASDSRQQDKASRPDLKITVPGIVVRDESGRLMITFDSGLFARGTRLSPDAKPLLSRLALQMEPYAGQISVQVRGFSDSVPMPAHRRYVDNAALGMARALKVVDYMRNTSRLPEDMFSLESQGEAPDPYPNDSLEDRQRNRTVVMKISSRH
jgi:flagellar motor protein MotB